MGERIDHAAEAERLIAEAQESRREGYHIPAEAALQEAQVHATLALVEQQRLAALVAFASSPENSYDWIIASSSEADQLKAEIRKGLGL